MSNNNIIGANNGIDLNTSPSMDAKINTNTDQKRVQTVDLHIHSKFSDGTDMPDEIVRKAKEAKLEVIALTDHDSINGCEEFLALCDNAGIRGIPGIEISCEDLDGIKEIHLLGYFPKERFRKAKKELTRYSEDRKRARNARLDKIIYLLRQDGIMIDRDEVIKEADDNMPGRPHIANVVYRMNPGRFNTQKDVFKEYLDDGAKTYVPTEEKLVLKDAINLVKTIGGIVILAHPGVLNGKQRDLSLGEKVLLTAIEFGVDGGEGGYVYHKNNPYNGDDQSITPKLCNYFTDILLKKGKIVTCGSDYHGSIKTIRLGEQQGRVHNYDFN